MPDTVFLLGKGIHRFHWSVNIKACRIFRFQHLRGSCKRARRIAILHKEEPLAFVLLEAAGLFKDRLIRDTGVGALVPVDLKSFRGSLGALIRRSHGDDPPRSRPSLVVDDDGLDEARHFLRGTVIDGFYNGTKTNRRQSELAVNHAGDESVDAVFRGAVRFRGDVQLLYGATDKHILIRGLENDCFQFLRRPRLCGLAAGDDLAVGQALSRL